MEGFKYGPFDFNVQIKIIPNISAYYICKWTDPILYMRGETQFNNPRASHRFVFQPFFIMVFLTFDTLRAALIVLTEYGVPSLNNYISQLNVRKTIMKKYWKTNLWLA